MDIILIILVIILIVIPFFTALEKKQRTYLFICVSCLTILRAIAARTGSPSAGCSSLTNLFEEDPNKLMNCDEIDQADFSGLTLGDCYVKSAYNCCALGDFKYGYVDVCGISHCLNRGVRFLDFSIYSIKNEPVVAVSSIENDYAIESYNYIPLAAALERAQDAFDYTQVNNFRDPLILNLRFFSNNPKIFNDTAMLLLQNFGNKLLSKKYSYEYAASKTSVKNISTALLSDLINQVIIFVSDKNQVLGETKLNELCNLSTGVNDSTYKCYHENDVKAYQGTKTLIEFNKYGLTAAIPNLDSTPKNPDSDIMETASGVQFTAMCFQKNDNYLSRYEKKFIDYGYAFRPRPCSQRAVKIYVDTSDIKCEASLSRQDVQVQLPFPSTIKFKG